VPSAVEPPPFAWATDPMEVLPDIVAAALVPTAVESAVALAASPTAVALLPVVALFTPHSVEFVPGPTAQSTAAPAQAGAAIEIAARLTATLSDLRTELQYLYWLDTGAPLFTVVVPLLWAEGCHRMRPATFFYFQAKY